MKRNFRLLLLALGATLVSPVVATAQLIGTGTANNGYPFGGTFSSPGSVYQQVYAASNFSGAGSLDWVRFFNANPLTPGSYRSGTYDLYVSTTTKAVNGLSTSNFDSNRGTDNVLFASLTLTGAAAPTLSFAGSGFIYDPSMGNLLLDFRISGGPPPAFPFGSFWKSNNGDANGAFSRAHDFGTVYENWGLQTEFGFSPVTTTPEPGTVVLLASGLLGLGVVTVRRRRVS